MRPAAAAVGGVRGSSYGFELIAAVASSISAPWAAISWCGEEAQGGG